MYSSFELKSVIFLVRGLVWGIGHGFSASKGGGRLHGGAQEKRFHQQHPDHYGKRGLALVSSSSEQPSCPSGFQTGWPLSVKYEKHTFL